MTDDDRGRVEVWRAGLLEAAPENWQADASKIRPATSSAKPPRVAHNCEMPFPHEEVKDMSSRERSLAERAPGASAARFRALRPRARRWKRPPPFAGSVVPRVPLAPPLAGGLWRQVRR
uniref:Uncharacterized protein n=1 Tax=Setaria viridis TaxID=4556 RepID=A0A4U6VWQ6_SETVI|nr:hypothetical protein SEVIR_2G307000v2 [Setaria viridis]